MSLVLFKNCLKKKRKDFLQTVIRSTRYKILHSYATKKSQQKVYVYYANRAFYDVISWESKVINRKTRA